MEIDKTNKQKGKAMEIERMNIGSWGKARAFFDLITSEGFTIKGFKLVDGVNGLFVGFPSQKDNEGEYRDTVWAEKELKEQVNDMAKKHYESGMSGVDKQVHESPVGAGFAHKDTKAEKQTEVFEAEEIDENDIPF